MTEALEQQIQTLRSLYELERDSDGSSPWSIRRPLLPMAENEIPFEAVENEVAETIEPAMDEKGVTEHMYTRTLGELYVTQGALARALKVFQHLHKQDPVDAEIARRVEEIEADMLTKLESKKEVQVLDYDVADRGCLGSEEGASKADANEGLEEVEPARPLIGDYFKGPLTWKSRESS